MTVDEKKEYERLLQESDSPVRFAEEFSEAAGLGYSFQDCLRFAVSAGRNATSTPSVLNLEEWGAVEHPGPKTRGEQK